MSEVIENQIERARVQLAQLEAEQRRQVEADAENRARQAAQQAAAQALAAEVRRLVAEYNHAEGEQAARRARLFGALASVDGHRLVEFASGAVWSNAWPAGDGRALEISAQRCLGALNTSITRLECGPLGM